jgi:N-acetylneuraminic acid mutarotase
MQKLRAPRFHASLAVLLLLTFAASVAVRKGTWKTLRTVSLSRAKSCLAPPPAGSCTSFAGLIPLWKPAGVVYEYDPAARQVDEEEADGAAGPSRGARQLQQQDLRVRRFRVSDSGSAAWVPIDNAWEYDPATDSWKALAPMPIKRGAASAAVVGDRIYVIGGATTQPWAKENFLSQVTPQRGLGTVQAYDPKTNTWKELTPMPTPRNHAAIGAVNGKIYVIGGRVGAAFIGLASDTSLVEVYDPATDTWGVPGARMPTTRSALAYGVYNNRIYVAGGEFQDPTQQTVFRTFEEYDPASNAWAVLPPMAIARHGVAAAVIGNRFYAVSGDVQSSGRAWKCRRLSSLRSNLPNSKTQPRRHGGHGDPIYLRVLRASVVCDQNDVSRVVTVLRLG